MRTVRDLIALLQKEDQDLPVLLASDDDGNSFDLLSESFYPFGYAQYDLISGETYNEDDIVEYGSLKKVLVIYPAG